ncbi:peptide ABC transporter substrate-binding protein [Neorhizobium galegae]|uniref:peptide ABC transporter substrate-binding protein n=1 Tax=Neorhizobium galegae TaxID=399 RepID=UPI002103401B|nr:peptide ABC transporter substrate-binding protein [Neorhizobium galegae]MCQ1853771.1 peptide ABC transporter substrate-binding protein [Neorhizobium galegae]
MNKAIFLAAVAAAVLPLRAQAAPGTDGNLKILYWQAASTLNPYLSGIGKDVDAAALVVEPLARFDPQGNLIPLLSAEIPTKENGGISSDMTTITWKLRPGVKWSDGSDLTAKDAVFTWKYCTAPGAGCAASNTFDGVKSVVAKDDLTVEINFAQSTPYPYITFVSSTTPILQEKQFKDCVGEKIASCTAQNFAPIGTGPYVVKEFKPNDVAVFAMNPKFRDTDKPHFSSISIKGGGDAMSAARAVFNTGEADYGWNLQLSPDVFENLVSSGKARPVTAFGSMVEYLFLNLTDPSAELGDKRSTVEGGPNKFLSDIRVRKALSLAIDRAEISEVLYADQGEPSCNVVPAPSQFVSKANDSCLTPNVEQAKALLDEAGWKPGAGGIREKGGLKLKLSFLTSTSGVRQDTQAMLKQSWKAIGVDVDLRNVSGSVFFGGDAGNPDTRQKFYADIEMYTDNSKGIDQESYLSKWTCAAVPSPKTQWQGSNMPRYCSPDYDALAKTFRQTGTIEGRGELARKMNDMLVQSYTVIPLVHRGNVSGAVMSLQGNTMNPWDSELWDIANWSRAK